MKELLYKLFKEKGSALSRSDIDNCAELPSYNKLNSEGFKLIPLNEEFKIRLYDENPKYCKTCNNKLEYSSDIKVRKYCDQSCSAKTNNRIRVDKPIIKIDKDNNSIVESNCIQCNCVFSHKSCQPRSFCSQKCVKANQYDERVKQWLSGIHPGYVGKTRQLAKFVRKYLHETRGTACERCGWDERHPIDGAVLTEVEHIDGNAENNLLSNLKILCPNCHSMTPTFRARNKNSKRERN
ncbi:HNH endonuclease [Salmonella enterica subsp. enterica serovar Braenderup]|nr:HNH endonuclease [Salmonella enterica subsp. enterica serovar Braenderup]